MSAGRLSNRRARTSWFVEGTAIRVTSASMPPAALSVAVSFARAGARGGRRISICQASTCDSASPPSDSAGTSVATSSLASHWRNLRDGVRAVVEHPQGYGLGNAGVVAKRTGVDIRAGESTYLELGVDAGIAGLVAFLLWNLAILIGLWRRQAWLAASFVAVLLLGLQTDVIGVHWLAVAVWGMAGMALGPPRSARVSGSAQEGTVSS